MERVDRDHAVERLDGLLVPAKRGHLGPRESEPDIAVVGVRREVRLVGGGGGLAMAPRVFSQRGNEQPLAEAQPVEQSERLLQVGLALEAGRAVRLQVVVEAQRGVRHREGRVDGDGLLEEAPPGVPVRRAVGVGVHPQRVERRRRGLGHRQLLPRERAERLAQAAPDARGQRVERRQDVVLAIGPLRFGEHGRARLRVDELGRELVDVAHLRNAAGEDGLGALAHRQLRGGGLVQRIRRRTLHALQRLLHATGRQDVEVL